VVDQDGDPRPRLHEEIAKRQRSLCDGLTDHNPSVADAVIRE
jgi:hypothetical protein